jgi:hypothetical protein
MMKRETRYYAAETTGAVAEAQESELEVARKKADEENKKLGTSVGLRKFVGRTRGKGSVLISWNQFDDSVPESLPKTHEEFMNVAGISADEKGAAELLDLMIRGYNARAYEAASDPIAEYVNAAWPDEIQTGFRTVVRTYARNLEIPIDEAATEVRARYDKKFGTA